MVDEELNRQSAEVTGEEVMTCDLCGVAADRSSLELVDAAVFARGVQGDVDYVWVCPDCRRTLGDGDFEPEIEYI